MEYLVQRATMQIKKSAKKYGLLVIQIIIGTCMMSLSINATINFDTQIRDLKKNLVNPYVSLSDNIVNIVSKSTQKTASISERERGYIRDNFSAEKTAFYKQFSVMEGCIEDFNILFVDDRFYVEIMGMTELPQEGTILIGKNAKESLIGKYQFKDAKVREYFNEESQTFFGFSISDFVSLETVRYNSKNLLSDIAYTENSVQPVSFDEYIIFPIDIKQDLPCSSYVAMPLGSNDVKVVSNQMRDIQKYLNKQFPDKDFTVHNHLSEIEIPLSRNTAISELLNLLSGFIILIVMFGLIGLMFIVISKRRKEFAISLMCGAVYRQIIVEVFLEVLFVILTGAVFGNLLCIPFLPLLGGMGVKTAYSILSLLFCVLGAIFLSMIVCAVSLSKIKNIAPIHVLKGI